MFFSQGRRARRSDVRLWASLEHSGLLGAAAFSPVESSPPRPAALTDVRGSAANISLVFLVFMPEPSCHLLPVLSLPVPKLTCERFVQTLRCLNRHLFPVAVPAFGAVPDFDPRARSGASRRHVCRGSPVTPRCRLGGGERLLDESSRWRGSEPYPVLSLPFPRVVTHARGTGFPGPRDSSRAASAPPFLGWPEGRSAGRAGLPAVRGHATRWVSDERLLPTRGDSLMALPGDGLASGRKPSGRAGSLFYQRVPAARQRPLSVGLVFQPSV